MASQAPVVAIDGPSGAGKGTVARRLATVLGWNLLDSGALYRLVALAAEQQNVNLADHDAVAEVAAKLRARFGEQGGQERIYLDDVEVSDQIRTETCGEKASIVAIIPAVRLALVERQRAFATEPGLVADGRDMGTVVFPDAPLKVFLTASAEQRARRRHKQLKEKGIDVSLRGLSREIAERDQRDANRDVAPLLVADDSKVLDSTNLTPQEVVDEILAWLRRIGIAPA